MLKKTRLFVNHGGLNSVYESLYFGIFQLCLPQQEEQKLTALVAERKKFGLYVRNLGNLTAEEIEKRRRAWRPQIQKYRRILRAADGTTQACRETALLYRISGQKSRILIKIQLPCKKHAKNRRGNSIKLYKRKGLNLCRWTDKTVLFVWDIAIIHH